MTTQPILAGLFQAVSLTPPEKPAEFLPWALALVLGALLFLFTIRERERRQEITDLKAEKLALSSKLDDMQAALARLGIKYDNEKDARARDHARVANMILLARRKMDEPEDYEFEDVPTGVHNILQAVPTPDQRKQLDARTEDRLRRYVSNDPNSTPPEAFASPRAKQKSRPER